MEEQTPGEKNVRKEELCNRKIESGAYEIVLWVIPMAILPRMSIMINEKAI